jgi:hypothetical protein
MYNWGKRMARCPSHIHGQYNADHARMEGANAIFLKNNNTYEQYASVEALLVVDSSIVFVPNPSCTHRFLAKYTIYTHQTLHIWCVT